MYMLPNLHSLRYFFILFHCHLGHIPKTASALSLANSALLEAKRVFIWTRVGTQSYYAVRSRVPRVSTYACAVCMHRAPHQPRANLHLLSEPFMDPGSRQKPKRQLFFFPQFNDDAAWQVSTSLSPTPHVRTVDDDRRRPKWAHSDLASSTDPQTALSTPWIFFPLPAPFPVRSLSASLCTAIQGCR